MKPSHFEEDIILEEDKEVEALEVKVREADHKRNCIAYFVGKIKATPPNIVNTRLKSKKS